MSYCRWSSYYPYNTIPVEEYMDMMCSKDEDKFTKIKNLVAERGGVMSCWYIFWSDYSGDTREEQLLSVWPTSTDLTPDYTYSQIKHCVNNNVYSSIVGFEDCDDLNKELCIDCLKSWLEDAEKEYD